MTTATEDLHRIPDWQTLATERDVALVRMYDELGFQRLAAARQIDLEPLPVETATRTYRQLDGRIKTIETYHDAEPDGPAERFGRLIDHVNGALVRFRLGWLAPDGTDRLPPGRPKIADVRREMRRGYGRKPVTKEMQRRELAAWIEMSKEWLAVMRKAGLILVPDYARCLLDVEEGERRLAS